MIHIVRAIQAIAERPGTSILGLTYDHPVHGERVYNLRAGDSLTQANPQGCVPMNRVSHFASGTGNALLRVVDHNGGEIPKCFDLYRIKGIRCGEIRV